MIISKYLILIYLSLLHLSQSASSSSSSSTKTTETESASNPANRKAPFRHRNLDYWDASTLAAYLSVSPTYPHDLLIDDDGATTSSSNNNNNNNNNASSTPNYAGNDAAVLFYAQWCQNCHSLAPMWGQIADLIHAGTTQSNVILALFDCEQEQVHKTLCSAAGITHYPTMLFIGKGTYHDTDPVTSVLMGKDRSAGPMGRSCLPHTVKFQGDWRYGEQIMDWIAIMKSLSSWSKWMEGNAGGKYQKDGGLIGKFIRWIIRPFGGTAGSTASHKGEVNGKKDDQMPIGIPPEMAMKQALAESKTLGSNTASGGGTADADGGNAASIAQTLLQSSKLEKQLEKTQNELNQYQEASTHSSLLIDLLLFPPLSNQNETETDTTNTTTLRPGEDIFTVLQHTWDDYAKLGEILFDQSTKDKTIPLLQSCVVDMTIDYCTRFITKNTQDTYDILGQKGNVDNQKDILAEIQSREEPFCNIVENCIALDFTSEECRPEKCPFANPMACQYVSSCLNEHMVDVYDKATSDVFAEYQTGQEAKQEQGDKEKVETPKKTGWGFGSG